MPTEHMNIHYLRKGQNLPIYPGLHNYIKREEKRVFHSTKYFLKYKGHPVYLIYSVVMITPCQVVVLIIYASLISIKKTVFTEIDTLALFMQLCFSYYNDQIL